MRDTVRRDAVEVPNDDQRRSYSGGGLSEGTSGNHTQRTDSVPSLEHRPTVTVGVVGLGTDRYHRRDSYRQVPTQVEDKERRDTPGVPEPMFHESRLTGIDSNSTHYDHPKGV